MNTATPIPRLSVVIPTHDTRELTLSCLASLQTPDDAADEAWLEVIVVDDGSSDGTGEAIRERFPTLRILRRDQATGFTAAVNLGVQESRGEILLLLNSDTEVEPGSLAALLDAFDADPRLGIAGAELHDPDGTPQWSAGCEPTLSWLFALSSGVPVLLEHLPGYRRLRPLRASERGRVDWVTGAALAVHRRAWEEGGPLDAGFRFYCQDLDLCLHLKDLGWGVAVIPGFRVMHHRGATIGKTKGAESRRSHPELLWNDFVILAQKRRGDGWARWVRRTLYLGTAVRLVGRWLALPFVGRAQRAAWRRDTAAYAAALRNLTVSP